MDNRIFQEAIALQTLQKRHQIVFEKSRLAYYAGCRLNILIVADSFLYFNDENFGFSELIETLKSIGTTKYPVTVNLAHRNNPGPDRLNGATPNYVFEYDQLKRYHQVWIMAAQTRSSPPITDSERLAIKRFMDEGGGIFATGDHADLGVSVGGYIPRVRSMRHWFWPSPGPNGEPVAPDGTSAARHDTNREGHDPGFAFNDQSDDVPQNITPRYFGGIIQSVHPLLCSSTGPITVLPDHPHEGECVVPRDLDASYTIGEETFVEYPDGPSGRPLSPVVVATSTMIPGAEVPGRKPPVPGGTFGAIAAWDGHIAGKYGRVVVDATWHHFTNINLIGDRGLGMPNPSVPKSMGFLHSAAGLAHYDKIKNYFTNIANWLTPRSMRRCWRFRSIWWLVNQGELRENLQLDNPIATGKLGFEVLKLLGPCERYLFLEDLFIEREIPLPGLINPFAERSDEISEVVKALGEEEAKLLADDIAAAFMGAAIVEFIELDMSVERLRKEFGDEEAEIPMFTEAAQRAVEKGFSIINERLEKQENLRSVVLKAMR
ncbi:MAG: hypothetical protein AAFN40_14725 [Cyanobacteria bacterium J06560_6]